jgi:hypothetical protein
MTLDFNKLTDEQKEYVLKYSTVHKKLTGLQSEMEDIERRIVETIDELEDIRLNENKIFNNGKEK